MSNTSMFDEEDDLPLAWLLDSDSMDDTDDDPDYVPQKVLIPSWNVLQLYYHIVISILYYLFII